MSTRGTTGGAATGRGRTGNRGSTAASRAPPEVIAVPANPQQSPPYPIDVEAIEDEVQVLSSSAGFPQPRSRPRRNRLVTVILDDDAVVILDDDAEVSAGVAGVTSEEPSTTLSLNTHERHQRLPPNGTAVNSEINSNSPGSTQQTVGQFSSEPKQVVPEEPTFGCPVCLNALVEASTTICGHIFCQNCIKTSIQKHKKCPVCGRKLTKNNFHRVYLPCTN